MFSDFETLIFFPSHVLRRRRCSLAGRPLTALPAQNLPLAPPPVCLPSQVASPPVVGLLSSRAAGIAGRDTVGRRPPELERRRHSRSQRHPPVHPPCLMKLVASRARGGGILPSLRRRRPPPALVLAAHAIGGLPRSCQRLWPASRPPSAR
jgi:hypothetical protein